MARKKGHKKAASKLKVMMLGGLNEIGKNIAVLEYEDDIIVIDWRTCVSGRRHARNPTSLFRT